MKIPRQKALNVKVSKGVLTIEIGVDTLQYAAENHPDYWHPENDVFLLKVTDADLLADEVRYALLDESEDGGTSVSRLIDSAIAHCVENGSQGIDYDELERRQYSPSESEGKPHDQR